MFWGFVTTLVLLLIMVGWSLVEICRVDRVIDEVDRRLGPEENASRDGGSADGKDG